VQRFSALVEVELGLILGESMAMDCCRLATVGLDNTVENWQAWHELLYSAPGLGNVTSLLPCILEFLGFFYLLFIIAAM
jgi:hypothetical protein